MFANLSAPRLALIIYVAGYFLYLIPALAWGWTQNLESFTGFVLWQAILYAPLWPFVLSAQAFALIAPILAGA